MTSYMIESLFQIIPTLLFAFGIIFFSIHRLKVLNKQKYKSENEDTPEYLNNWIGNDPQYASIVQKHLERIEKEEMMYSVIYNFKLYHSNEAKELESLCIEDINCVNEFITLHKKYNSQLPPNYNSFKRLAILYERQKEYEKAAIVCAKSISLGFIHDGTNGQMYGRLARMIRLANINTPMDEYVKLNANNPL